MNPLAGRRSSESALLDTPRIALRVVPEPSNGARPILELESPGTVFVRGEADPILYVCGDCGATLLENVWEDQVENVVFACSSCGAYNESPT